MKLPLDTHAFVWWVLDDAKLSDPARAAIAANAPATFDSVASAWEVAIKVGVGKWPEAVALLDEAEKAISDEGFVLLPITVPHVRAAGLMTASHRDPFDRLLVAQATTDVMTLVIADPAGLGAPVLW